MAAVHTIINIHLCKLSQTANDDDGDDDGDGDGDDDDDYNDLIGNDGEQSSWLSMK